jgi:hypothetical protein
LGALRLKCVVPNKDLFNKGENTMEKKPIACETCAIRMKAEANPKTLMARIWKWHTGWCPGWKAYQKSLQGG